MPGTHCGDFTLASTNITATEVSWILLGSNFSPARWVQSEDQDFKLQVRVRRPRERRNGVGSPWKLLEKSLYPQGMFAAKLSA